MRTILVANRKGGVGKTMIAVTLASALARSGDRVALADADRQQSASGWLERRPDTVSQIRALDWSRADDIGSYPKKLDWLVIDAPGALRGSRAEALIAASRAIVTPVQPSIFDEAATRAFLADIEDLKRVRKGKTAVHVVPNRVRPRSRASEALGQFLAATGVVPLTWISERAVYGDLAAAGMTIFDRDLVTMRRAREQWIPILDAIGARAP